jgi:hypothetical protein
MSNGTNLVCQPSVTGSQHETSDQKPDPKINQLRETSASPKRRLARRPSDDLANAQTGMASQLAHAGPRKLAALAGGFDRAPTRFRFLE